MGIHDYFWELLDYILYKGNQIWCMNHLIKADVNKELLLVAMVLNWLHNVPSKNEHVFKIDTLAMIFRKGMCAT